jgi:putative Holliday junction resolvase
MIATPLEVYERRGDAHDAAHYKTLVADEDIERILIGLPVHTSGGESQISSLARTWGAWLASQTGLPIVFFDERFTSADAEELLLAHGLTSKDRKARRDKLAAQILLQSYLDAGCPETEAPAMPLADEPREGREQ